MEIVWHRSARMQKRQVVGGGGWRTRPTKAMTDPAWHSPVGPYKHLHTSPLQPARAPSVVKQHGSGPLSNMGQKSRDPPVPFLHHWLKLKPVPGGRIRGRFYNRLAWPEANCAVCKPERSNEDLANRRHDRIPETVPGFRSLDPSLRFDPRSDGGGGSPPPPSTFLHVAKKTKIN